LFNSIVINIIFSRYIFAVFGEVVIIYQNKKLVEVKFYSNQIANIADSMAKDAMNAALFYGPDHGLIEYSIGKISKILGLERRNISFGDISAEELNGLA
jgi:DNA polymerase III delta subunit